MEVTCKVEEKVKSDNIQSRALWGQSSVAEERQQPVQFEGKS